MIKKIFLLCGLVLSIGELYAQTAPKYSNDFLDIGVGARALAMGNSVVASNSDVTSGYWNPAGLMGVTGDIEISLMHDEYFAGIAKDDYLAASYKFDKNSVFGLTIIRFGVDNIPNTLYLIDPTGNVNYNNITSFSVADYAFLFSYARSFDGIKGLTIGGNVKVLRSIVGDFGGAWGFGLDGGAQYKYKDWLFGAVGRDITSTFNAWSYNLSPTDVAALEETNNVPPSGGLEVTLPRLLLGAARTFKLFHEKVTLMPELGADITFDGKRNTIISSDPVSVDPHLGVEAGYRGIVFLRLGVGNIQTSTDVTGAAGTYFSPDFGVGIKIKSFALDYALTDNTAAGLYSNVFSVKFDINKKPR
ncbi:MAG TPA: PorV/PorQ family protein [Bacteroidia bacterium]|jgi:hypothetical protein|nr:PorV/PorQ family protein [Bacteroidia bacterium]